MALLDMKRISVVSPQNSSRELLTRLFRLGWVEIEQFSPEEGSPLLSTKEDDTLAEANKNALARALVTLNKISPYKKSMLAPKRETTEQRLFDKERMESALKYAEEINGYSNDIERARVEITRLETSVHAMKPWQEASIPLNYEGRRSVRFLFGTLPAQIKLEAAEQALDDSGAAYEIINVSGDSNFHYVILICYRPDARAALEALKPFTFSRMQFKNIDTDAKTEVKRIEAKIEEQTAFIEKTRIKIAGYSRHRELLEDGVDAYTQEHNKDDILSSLGRTAKTTVLEGWIPAEKQDAAESVFAKFGCAYEFDDPQPKQKPPTAMKNNKLTAPFGAITEMYGMPAYGSIVDPNPLITPFYAIIFGLIMADMGYGLLMIIGTQIMIRKKKLKGPSAYMLQMFFYCGFTTFIAGMLTGGFFADAVYQFSSKFLPKAISIAPLWFNPLDDPITFLILSLVVGAVHIMFGMGVSAYRSIRQKDYAAALGDTASWFLIFIGAGVYFGLKAQVGLYLVIAGVALMLIFGGHGKKGFARIFGGISKVTDISGYLSDLFSYARIMALALSGAVVGQVMNTMGSMGSGIIGAIVFVIVFIVGHVFNLAISGLGAYVHTSRLQYIEFFGKFYADGGRMFKPVSNKTKYTDIIMEEK